MLIGEIIQRFVSTYSHGIGSKDRSLSDRHIYSACRTGRSAVLRQRANKHQNISDWNYQTLSCIDLAPHRVNKLVQSVVVLRSVNKIPQVISSLGGPLIQSMYSLDGSARYDSTTFSTAKYEIGNKFTALKPKGYIKDNHLTLTILKHLDVVTMTALFEDPLEAALFTSSLCEENCVDCLCKSAYDYDFHLDADLVDRVLVLARTELLAVFGQMREDKNNNASDDTVQGRIPQQQNNNDGQAD